jgi:homopolymeric O-antigen transport system permease protein
MLLNNRIGSGYKQQFLLPSPLSTSLRGLTSLFRHLHLLRELIKRDFHARFTGSALGIFWAVLQPVLLVVLYWFVFTFMFKRAAAPSGHGEYIYFLVSGLIPWQAMNEGLVRSTTSIVENGPMVRRLSFRGEMLVIVPNATALIFECLAFIVFIVFLVLKQGLPTTVWLLPFALLIQFGLQLGLSLILAAAYVFFRDLAQLLGFFLSMIFYLSPILYYPPERFRSFFIWNPLTPLLGLFRSAMLSEALPEVGSIVFLLVACSATFVAGLFFFRRVEPGLVDLV